VLGYFAGVRTFANRETEASVMLDSGLGEELLALNAAISRGIAARAHAEYYGPQREFRISIIVCLYGKPEWMFLQNAMFATTEGIGEVEFIYVSNSPELVEALDKEARIAALIYRLSITLVTLPGNAGFSAANNEAARFARSERLIFLNPDVFPRDDQWLVAHASILASEPMARTRLFGVPLYYDDGSLMHGGMFFDIDHALSVKPDGIQRHALVRVEHYGKGAPAWAPIERVGRPVPAITGAFVSIERAWFEEIGGFNETYIFGHYEDADLCLKSLEKGVPAWLHHVAFWHLEGKGSTRHPVHEGGALVNRWWFTRRWRALIESQVAGSSPSHPLLCDEGVVGHD
jgi:GT2 family glycosyltransferase